LIKPVPGTGLALLDWRQQEFGIGAALSGDRAMMAAYQSGDPFLAFAVSAGVAPPSATPDSHGAIRDRFKACALGVQYGMTAARLARQAQLDEPQAQALLDRHRSTFARFWSWSDSVENHALLHGELQPVFGWRIAVGSNANPRSLQNFPMQANGAEMLRLACCLAVEGGIKVCATIHDAILIEAPLDEFTATIANAQRIMADASSTLLDGFRLRTSGQTAIAPDRWCDERGRTVWAAVEQLTGAEATPAHQREGSCSPKSTRPISSMSLEG
jgi:DNA polymerase I